jgi:hypothetical protein
MYEIKRENGRVIILKGADQVFNAPETAYVVYENNGSKQVNTIKELPDVALLLALANAIFLKS